MVYSGEFVDVEAGEIDKIAVGELKGGQPVAEKASGCLRFSKKASSL